MSQHPDRIGGQLVRPEDIVVADGDGVHDGAAQELTEGVATYAHQERTNDRIGRGRLYQALGWAPDETVDTPDPVDAGWGSGLGPGGRPGAHRLSRATPEPLGVPVPRALAGGAVPGDDRADESASAYLSFAHYNILSPPEWIGLDNFVQLAADPGS